MLITYSQLGLYLTEAELWIHVPVNWAMIDSENGLPPVPCQAIIQNNGEYLTEI